MIKLKRCWWVGCSSRAVEGSAALQCSDSGHQLENGKEMYKLASKLLDCSSLGMRGDKARLCVLKLAQVSF